MIKTRVGIDDIIPSTWHNSTNPTA